MATYPGLAGAGKRRIYVAKHKPTGRRYKFLARFAWGKAQYTADLTNPNPEYFPKLKLAREHAEKLGVLAEITEADAGNLLVGQFINR